MKKLYPALFAMAAVLAIAPAALADAVTGTLTVGSPTGTFNIGADPLFTYTFVGSGLDTTLTFAGTGNGDGTYTITNVSGTVYTAGSDITSPVAINEAPIYDPNGTASNIVTYGNVEVEYDNQLFPNDTPALDFSGVLFDVNGLYINIYGVGDGYEWLDSGSYTNPSNSTQPVGAVPEPGSLFLLGTGLLGLAFLAFRKAKTSGLVLHP